ncbi:MAG: hypothetical protein DMF12_09845 [Verrucomicrobia bacterium]|nr:MAG: hypothetical protein DMF12_09845 [Verrucomicrobiota bacterium]
MSAAAATAFVAVKPSGPVFLAKAENKGGIDKLRQNRAELFRSKMTLPGPEREGGPVSAAEEDYAKRALPATDIPIALRRNAHAAWASVRGRSGREAANALGAWTLAGPSTSNAPDILTFSGAAYTTSGRITALAVDPSCNTRRCRVWAAAAGGGVWRTTNALAGSRADWTFVSGSFATNAIGTLTYDAATGALYAGTGEPNASGDSEAGFGIYKSTDGGNTWTHLAANTTVPVMATPCGDAPAYTGPAFDGRATSSIVVRGNTMYVGSTRAVRGVSSVTGGGVTLAPGLPPYGLWKSTDGGATFALLAPEGVCLNPALPGDAGKIQASFGSARGVNDVEFDPNYATNTTLYAAAFPRLTASGGGVWRSNDDGANWTQIKTALAPNNINDRAEFAVTLLGSGTTRMYVGDGNTGSPAARFYRSDDVATGSPTFTDLTTTQNEDYCTGQCWYDNVVYSPPGKPDVVYLGGSYSYGSYGFTTNGRAFIRSADAGASFTDMTWDATTNPTPPGSCCQPNPIAPNGQHPDSHAIVEIPGTNSAIFGGDGGLMRSSGAFADISGQCTTYRGLTGTDLALCQQLLSAVPTYLYNLNKGLSTLQFQSLSVAADNPKHLQGGTQDNGTFETTGSAVTWPQIIYGDGGQSGFNVVNSAADPSVAGTIFVGLTSVWRTQDWGGNQATLEANCPEFTTAGNQPGCGDFVRIGDGVPSASLTSSAWGDRAGGNVAAVERTPSNTGTLWAATTTGRVFISSNADAAAGSVHYTRLDSLASNDPNRFVSGVYVDPANANHAWICYSSYSSLTPTTPGHVFSVTYDPIGGTATWTNLDGSGPTAFPDFPATDIVHDSNGDLYVSNDWGVLRRANGSSDWVVAGTGLPMVEVAGLTIVPSARVLYAATHGRSAWKLTLP